MQLGNITAPSAMESLGASVNPFATATTAPGGGGIMATVNNGLQNLLNLYGQYEGIQAMRDAAKQPASPQYVYVPEPQAQAQQNTLPKWLIPAGITAAGLLLVVAMTRPKGRRR